VLALLLTLSSSLFAQSSLYHHKIRPIIDNRCVACHSCYNAPCQLNLQDSAGFERGASKERVYEGTRLKSVSPTRMWVDGFSEADWRKKKFYSVKDIFFSMLSKKQGDVYPIDKVMDSQFCAEGEKESKTFLSGYPEKTMPYGFPALTEIELAEIKIWMDKGAPGAEMVRAPSSLANSIQSWEAFLNGKGNKQKLISRYLYEHLFLAHMFFPEDKKIFFRLIRTDKTCSENSNEVATRRPNESTGLKEVFYCMRPYQGAIVAKTHIPYEISLKKLARIKTIFSKAPWTVKHLPGYEPKVAENPFIAFQDIPVKARYEFLLEDSRYHLNTFIKGPVCNGSQAVNSIQEQFFVAFMDPRSDLLVMSHKFEELTKSKLILPGVGGSDLQFSGASKLFNELLKKREDYRSLRAHWLMKLKPLGLDFKDLWSGRDALRPTPFLTVFRHDDNAVVLKGFKGDLPKTLFFLDYALFERLVYNLVVNFDVFGNVGHQGLTRIYMDMIRMEAEEMFLSFLPNENRKTLRQDWYKGFFTELKMKYIFPLVNGGYPNKMKFTEKDTKSEFVERLVANFDADLVGRDDINWKHISSPGFKNLERNEGLTVLRDLSSRNSNHQGQYSQYFPDFSVIKIFINGKPNFYSIVHNREHENVAWILDEEGRFAPSEDTLTILPGIVGPYLNMIFDVPEELTQKFSKDVQKVDSEKSFAELVKRYGIPRNHKEFWRAYDEINSHYITTDPEEGGILDLTRYSQLKR
jgi:hypothetical protein